MKNLQVTMSGNVVEIDETLFAPSMTTYKRNGGRKPKGVSDSKEFDEQQYKKQCRTSAKKLTRLIQCNFSQHFTFITLTFNIDVPFDSTNLGLCSEELRKFIKRLRSSPYFKNADLSYIAVPEFHKDGRIHFHMLCYLNKNDKYLIERIWKHGFIDMHYVENTALDDLKVANYLKKDMLDPRLIGAKKYYCSQGLKRPIKLLFTDEQLLEEILEAHEAIHLAGYDFDNTAYGYVRHDEYYAHIPEEVIRDAAVN